MPSMRRPYRSKWHAEGTLKVFQADCAGSIPVTRSTAVSRPSFSGVPRQPLLLGPLLRRHDARAPSESACDNIAVSGANWHASMLVEPILDSTPANKRGGRGHPRRRPLKLHAGKGSDNRRARRYLRPPRGITARVARIGRDSSQRLGGHRWVVERIIGWLLSCNASSCIMTAPP